MRKLIFPIFMGLAGCAVLISLGMWQVQRLNWKQAILAEIDMRMAADPIALPDTPSPDVDKYQPVLVDGHLVDAPIYVLTSIQGEGPGYRVIQALETEPGTRILVDRGFVLSAQKGQLDPVNAVSYQGNLHWPDETDEWTPAPDGDLWFARDVDAMSAALDTRPVMVVVATRSQSDPQMTPLPLDTSGISNDHMEYAITWFSLALVWAAMTLYLIYRTSKAKDA